MPAWQRKKLPFVWYPPPLFVLHYIKLFTVIQLFVPDK